ncbi:hypothetical protein [Paraflavitalea sp. CAU 1676]|uniref:hypothetical protein n=1 Tax=Paraflavitalea sp. CAU 1676 TaxID=3032598 RepID=UPI0023DC0C0B|nr:hypothetical protein [Paraflavitalea sp. CAU 1676]MDF2190556.1 hypothetical protein [Paraflavitalea sp. CAU 1676]
MIESIIATSHHYYLLFFESEKLRNWNSIPEVFDRHYECEVLSGSKSKGDGLFHMQMEFESPFGSETLLTSNISRKVKGSVYYWYDFYYGKVNPDSSVWFLCFPYSKFSKYIEKSFKEKGIFPKFLKSNVPSVLSYLKDRVNGERVTSIERKGFNIDITKYTAEVKESANANKVSLLGVNPLNSKIYDVLNSSTEISIEATALRVKCDLLHKDIDKKGAKGQIELSFDRIGNFRFWLKRETYLEDLALLRYIYLYFSEIKSLEKSTFLSSQNLLDDE